MKFGVSKDHGSRFNPTGNTKPAKAEPEEDEDFLPGDDDEGETGIPESDDEEDDEVEEPKPTRRAKPEPKADADPEAPNDDFGDEWYGVGDEIGEWDKQQDEEYARKRRPLCFIKDGGRFVLRRAQPIAGFKVHTVKRPGKNGKPAFETEVCTSRSGFCAGCNTRAKNVSEAAMRHLWEVVDLSQYEDRNGKKHFAKPAFLLATQKVSGLLFRQCERVRDITSKVLCADVTGVAPQLNYSFSVEDPTPKDVKHIAAAEPFEKGEWKKFFAPRSRKEQIAYYASAAGASPDEDEDEDI